MKNFKYLIASLVCLGITTSCQHGEVADAGHQVKIMVFHHTVPVSNCLVAIKEIQVDFPGWNENNYDFVGRSDSTGLVEFDGLISGNHYMMGRGHDGIDSVKGYGQLALIPGNEDSPQRFILHVTE